MKKTSADTDGLCRLRNIILVFHELAFNKGPFESRLGPFQVLDVERIPFGPYLAVGATVVLFWGRAIWRWYSSLFNQGLG